MKLYEINEPKMPGVMKSLIIDLQRLVPWPFERMDASEEGKIWFRSLAPPSDVAKNKLRGYIHVTYKKWPGNPDFWSISVTTKGDHNDAVIESVKRHRKTTNINIGGTASYPDRTQAF